MNRYDGIDAEIKTIADSLGLRIGRRILSGTSGFDYEVRLLDISPPYGFSLIIGDDYLSWMIRLEMDDSSAPLIRLMGQNSKLRSGMFSALHAFLIERSSRVELRVNGKTLKDLDTTEIWESIRFETTRNYEVIEEAFNCLRELLLDSLSTILCLVINQEEWTESPEDVSPNLEGDRQNIVLSRPERNRYNRAICLQYHGFSCFGCGYKMDEIYGPIGSGVIHVHHLVPLADLTGPVKVDPILDLVPLCPNCHNIVHRVSPPLSIKALQDLTGYSSK
jgi:5-methylcytosine-specific restriction protein A